MEAGLAAGERTLYVADGRTPDEVATWLGGDDLELGEPLRSGQLRVAPATRGDRAAEPLAMGAAAIEREAARAREEGYAGLRVTAELDGQAAAASLDGLMRSEEMAARALRRAGAIGMCQFDAGRLDADAIAAMAARHDGAAVDGGARPLARLEARDAPYGLRVIGEIDVSNAATLERAIRARAATRPEVVLDLRRMRFIDIAGLRGIHAVADDLAPGELIRLSGAPAYLRRHIALLDMEHPRIEVTEL